VRKWVGQRNRSLWVFIAFGLAEVAGFFVAFIGFVGLMRDGFDVEQDWPGAAGLVLGILAVAWIDHLCAYKTGRCWVPWRGGCPK
jgi:hypothetical protein